MCPKLRQILTHLAKASLPCIFHLCYVAYREFGQCVCEKCYVLNEKCSFAMLLRSVHRAKVLPKIV